MNQNPVLHDILTFSFDAGSTRVEQMAMVRTLGSIKRRMAGYISFEVFLAPEHDLWVAHSCWSKDQNGFLHGLTQAEADAILQRLKDKVELVPFVDTD